MKRLLFVSLALSALGCGDPYRDRLIDGLPPEDPKVHRGPMHRPGQPCLACHSDYGGAPDFSIAGTLFSAAGPSETPTMMSGYTVRVYDSEGQTRDVVSNTCGNFFIPRFEWDPAFPLRAELYEPNPAKPGKLTQVTVMSSRIAREGSCAGCHIGHPSPLSPGFVYVPGTKPSTPDESCPTPWLGPDPRAPIQGAP
jgi:hypothetical protein